MGSNDDDPADDSWSEASEGEQQAWLRSALIECETKLVEVDPRYEIHIEPVDFADELSSFKTISFNVATTSPSKRNPGQPTHCSVSASMPNFNLKLLGEGMIEKVPDATKLRTYPRRKSSEGKKTAKKKHSVPGFMRETEAWSKRRSISNAAPVSRGNLQCGLKRSISNSIVSKSVCGISSKTKPITSQSQIFFKSSKPRSRSPTGLRRPLKQKHNSKQPITKRSIHFPILRNLIQIESDEEGLVPLRSKDSSRHWDRILLEPDHWPSNSKTDVEPRARSCSQNQILADIASQQKTKNLSVENFDASFSHSKPLPRLVGVNELESDSEMADDTCLIGLYNDDESLDDVQADTASRPQTISEYGRRSNVHPRLASERNSGNSEVEQLRKALSDVSLMYQDQVQSLKRQLFSTLEQFEYDRKQIAFLKRKLAENAYPEQVRGR